MTLRERLPTDPPQADFERFRDALDEIRAYSQQANEVASYLRHAPRVDEPSKLHRTLVRIERVERAEALAKELAELVEEIERSAVQVVWGQGDLARGT